MNFTAVYTDSYDGVGKKEEFTVKFVREGSFYKIDEIDGGIEMDFAQCLWGYTEFIYEDISISL